MQLQAKTSQRLEQRLLPQMLQSIEILQLATTDLLQLVAQQMETNEVLELAPAAETAALSAEIVDSTMRTAAEWDAAGVRASSDEVDGRRALLENHPAPADELLSSVRLQASLRGLPGEMTEAIGTLCEHLDERGLLAYPLDVVAESACLQLSLLQRALVELQSMEPKGLGASTGIEAMLLQAKGDPDYAVIEQLLTRHLEALAANKWPEVARAVRLEVAELAALIERMRELSPAPADSLRSEAEPSIAADVAVWLFDGAIQVALAEDGVPQLAVNELYASMASDRSVDVAVREHLRSRVRAAKELMEAIAHRQSTLLRVVQVVFEHQRDFLVRGRVALRPLRMMDIAAELAMHPSTISRAIAGKYVATTMGTMLLRDFCSSGSADGIAAAGHARGAVAERLQGLLEAEDKSKPWSDDALVEKLAEEGIQGARRTVAKLRDELDIPSSYRRRQHGERTT